MKKSPGHSPPKFFISSIILAIFLGPFLSFQIANAGDVTLGWDANTEKYLVGYKLYYESDSSTEIYKGVGATEGDSPIFIYLADLADYNSPTFTLTGLEDGQYYYFALTAFDTFGFESDFSDEVGTIISSSSSTDSSDNVGGGGDGGGCFISGLF